MSPVTFFVEGIPIPQGSMTAYVVGKRAVLTDQKKKVLKPWRAAIADRAAGSWLDRVQLTGPVEVYAVFVFERPKTVTRRMPSVKGADLDKLVRALLDGIGDAKTVWKDDSQVVRLVVEKVYGAAPGVHASVSEVSADQLTRGERLLAGMEKEA